MHLPVLCSHIYSMGKLIMIFLYPPHSLSQFGTITLCHCRVVYIAEPLLLQSFLVPTSGGDSAPGAIYSLGQTAWENSDLSLFLQENFGVQFLPEGSTPQWEGGAATAQYLQLARVLPCLHIFPLGTFFLHACAHPCAYV